MNFYNFSCNFFYPISILLPSFFSQVISINYSLLAKMPLFFKSNNTWIFFDRWFWFRFCRNLQYDMSWFWCILLYLSLMNLIGEMKATNDECCKASNCFSNNYFNHMNIDL